MTDDIEWKKRHADDSFTAVEHPLVMKVCAELLHNLGQPADGLAAYGVQKVAMYAAQVARAQALGFDPDLLRMTPEEADSALWRRAAEAVMAGVPVVRIEPGESA